MPANLPLPQGAGVYQGAYNPFVDIPFGKPAEGYKRIPLSIAWGTDDLSGAVTTGAVQFQMAGRQSEFKQVGGMYVDNTQSGADVVIVFPEAQFEFTCAAGEKDYFQISSPSLNFFVLATGALSSDKTFLQVYNYAPRPLSTYKSVFMSAANVSAMNLTGNGSSTLISATNNGTVTGISLGISGLAGGDATTMVTVKLHDGASSPNVLAQKIIVGVAGGYVAPLIPYLPLFDLTGVNLRFSTSLTLQVVVAGTALTAGVVSGTVYYRTP